MVARPFKLAGANHQLLGIAFNAVATALGHGPSAAAGAVQRDVNGAVVLRVNRRAVLGKRMCVVR